MSIPPDAWPLVDEIIEDALALPAAARLAHISNRCGGNAEMCAEVISLVKRANDAACILDPPTLVPINLNEHEAVGMTGRRVHQYTIGHRIGTGGMGDVYLATDEKLGRTVAIKIVRSGLSSAHEVRRFLNEAKALSRLQHPHIVQVFELGEFSDDHSIVQRVVPFIAMEFVPDAKHLLEFTEERQVGLNERLTLFIKICDAVHHGHLRAVIHRDIKPSNILVNDAGVPKLIDFGIARLLEQDVRTADTRTVAGALVGTPRYMSPEQCALDGRQIDARTDVYSLGVVFFEVLTGESPYQTTTTDFTEMMRIVRKEPPNRLTLVNRTLDVDLEIIANKALSKDPDQRFRSAAEFGEDLQRFLKGEPILARPPTLRYRARKFAGKHRALVGAAAAVAIVLVISVIGLGLLYQNAETRRREAAWESYRGNIAAASFALSQSRPSTVQMHLNEAMHAGAANQIMDWEWEYLNAARDQSVWESVPHSRIGSSWGPNMQSRSPDGRWLAASCARGGDCSVQLLDLHAPVLSTRVLPGHEKAVFSVAFSPDSRWLATGTGSGSIYLWDLFDENLSALKLDDSGQGHTQDVNDLVFSHNSKWLVSASLDSSVKTWDVASRRLLWTQHHGGQVWDLALHAERSVVASAGWDSKVYLWSIPELELLATVTHAKGVRAVAFIGRNDLLVSGSDDGAVFITKVTESQSTLIESIDDPNFRVSSLLYHPVADILAAGSKNGLIRLLKFDGESPPEVATLVGHAESVWALAFSPDGKLLASGSHDRTVRLWDVGQQKLVNTFRGHDYEVLDVDFANHRHVISVSRAGVMKCWDVGTPPIKRRFANPLNLLQSRYSDDSTRLAYCEVDAPIIRVVKTNDHEQGEILISNVPTDLDQVAFANKDTEILGRTRDGRHLIWDMNSGELVADRTFPGKLELSIDTVPFDHPVAGSCIAIPVAGEPRIRICDRNLNELVVATTGNEPAIYITASPDGRRLLAISGSGAAVVIDSLTGSLQRRLEQRFKSEPGIQPVFSPDGMMIATEFADDTLCVWDTETGEVLLEAEAPGFQNCAVNHHKTRVAVACHDDGRSHIVLVDVQTGSRVLTLETPSPGIVRIAFTEDDSKLMAFTSEGSVFEFDTVPYKRRSAQPGAAIH